MLSSIFASVQFKSNPICHMVLFIIKVFGNLLVTKRAKEEEAARVNPWLLTACSFLVSLHTLMFTAPKLSVVAQPLDRGPTGSH